MQLNGTTWSGMLPQCLVHFNRLDLSQIGMWYLRSKAERNSVNFLSSSEKYARDRDPVNFDNAPHLAHTLLWARIIYLLGYEILIAKSLWS